jgi:hypothetical protein
MQELYRFSEPFEYGAAQYLTANRIDFAENGSGPAA